jgi:UDP-N-acetyl-D-glucosamine dehydrogenase
MYYKNIQKLINSKKVTIAVVGLGYVGLPLFTLLKKKKFKCIGIDTDKKKIKLLQKKYNSKSKNYFFTKYEQIIKSDIVIYSLPTPLKNDKTPDLSILKNSIIHSKNFFRKGQLIVVESTSYPGTTKECFKNIIKNYETGKDFFIGYSPERIDPGNKYYSLENIPKITSGDTKKCSELTFLFFKKICKKVIKSSSIETAEFTKIYENIFRSINIGLANETKQIAKKLKINFEEVLNLAATKPFGFMRFDPGPGVGGHCIPVDPFYLSWLANKKGIQAKFIKLSGEINSNMPSIIASEIINFFKSKKITNPKVIILGLSYKKNIDDIRNSPAVEIFLKLKSKIKLSFEDKFVKVLKINKKSIFSNQIKNFSSVKLYDAVILATDHDYFNYKKILTHSKLIFDLRNKFPRSNKVIKL